MKRIPSKELITDKTECTFFSGTDWFRLRSCGILVHQGRVLMARNEKDPYYYSIGGCVHHGESLEAAAIREVKEETGWAFLLERLVFVHENFFRGKSGTIDGLRCHEIAFYFLMKWDPDTVLTNKSSTMGGVPERVEWLDIAELDRLELSVYPTFFARELFNLPKQVKHIVTFEQGF